MGGAEVNARLGRVVTFNVVPRPSSNSNPDPAHNDPAAVFMIRGASLSGPEFAFELDSPEDRSRLNPAGDTSLEAGFRGDSATGNTTPVGFVPVVLTVDGTAVVLTTYCAVYRASYHPDDAPLDSETAAVFDDLRNVFVNLIHNGTVLRAPAGGQGVDPEAGKMVRGRKRWSWQRDPVAWQLVDVMMVLNLRGGIPRKTTLPSRSLWTRFQQW